MEVTRLFTPLNLLIEVDMGDLRMFFKNSFLYIAQDNFNVSLSLNKLYTAFSRTLGPDFPFLYTFSDVDSAIPADF